MSLKDHFLDIATGLNTVPAEPVGLSAVIMDMGMQAQDPATIGFAAAALLTIATYAKVTGKDFRPDTAPANTPKPGTQ